MNQEICYTIYNDTGVIVPSVINRVRQMLRNGSPALLNLKDLNDMAIGAGKYDDLCTYVREQSESQGAIVIVLKGKYGHGFSIQASPALLIEMTDILETMARQIRNDLRCSVGTNSTGVA